MSNPQLSAYVNKRLAQGETPDAIKTNCLKEGWPAAEVDNAFTSNNTQTYSGPWFKGLFKRDYYLDILLGRRTYSLFVLLFIMAALFSIMPAVTISTRIYPVMKNIGNNINKIVDELMPDKAEIKISGGVASTTLVEPYYMTISKNTLDTIYPNLFGQYGKSKIRLLTIDTKAKAENFERYQSYALLTQSNVIYYNDGKVNILSLRDIGNQTITRESIKTKVNEFLQKNHTLTLLTVLFFASPLALEIMYGISILAELFSIAIVVFLMTKILAVPAKFKNTMRFTGLLSVVPLFLKVVSDDTFTLSGLSFNLDITDSFTALLIFWLAYLIMKNYGQSTGVKKI